MPEVIRGGPPMPNAGSRLFWPGLKSCTVCPSGLISVWCSIAVSRSLFNLGGYQGRGSRTGAGTQVESLQILCIFQYNFWLLKLNKMGQLRHLGHWDRESPTSNEFY